jgi:hypothetical protein
VQLPPGLFSNSAETLEGLIELTTENEMVPATLDAIAARGPAKHDVAKADSMAASDFPGYVKLITNRSDHVNKGFPVNHWGYFERSGDEPVDLGATVDALPLTWRPMALDTDLGAAYFDEDHPEYQRIQNDADSKVKNRMYGPQYLLWVPSIGKFATYFMGTPTARNESRSLTSNLRKPVTLSSRSITSKARPGKKSYTWQGPQILMCNTPFDLPELAEIKAQKEKFDNPPAPKVESDTDDTGSERD